MQDEARAPRLTPSAVSSGSPGTLPGRPLFRAAFPGCFSGRFPSRFSVPSSAVADFSRRFTPSTQSRIDRMSLAAAPRMFASCSSRSPSAPLALRASPLLR
ncbi:cation ABC transporter substrate-binding protein, partial [Burkholderia pseudomallei]